jgi:hypothetical protein
MRSFSIALSGTHGLAASTLRAALGRGAYGRWTKRGDPFGRNDGGAPGRVVFAKQPVGRGDCGQPGWQCCRYGDQAALYSLGPHVIGVAASLIRRSVTQFVRSESLLSAPCDCPVVLGPNRPSIASASAAPGLHRTGPSRKPRYQVEVEFRLGAPTRSDPIIQGFRA